MIKTILLLLCLLHIPIMSNAKLVSNDLYASNDGLLTLDTESGLEWLDLTVTSNQSIDDILGGFGGYIASGYRYATIDEVATLYTNAGIDIDSESSGNWQPVVDLIEIMGMTTVAGEFRWSEGFAGLDEPGNDSAYRPGVWRRETFTQGAGAVMPGTRVSFDASGDGVGSYLVRNAAVPIPAAMWFFGSGLIGLIVMARSKGDV